MKAKSLQEDEAWDSTASDEAWARPSKRICVDHVASSSVLSSLDSQAPVDGDQEISHEISNQQQCLSSRDPVVPYETYPSATFVQPREILPDCEVSSSGSSSTLQYDQAKTSGFTTPNLVCFGMVGS